DADRRGGRVDEVGELLARDAEPVEERTPDRARDQDRDVRLDEDDDAEDEGQDPGAAAVGDPLPFLDAPDEAAHAARRLDRRDERADDEGEDDDLGVPWV